MYKIEFYNKKGCFELPVSRFRTIGQAHRFARKHRGLVGFNYVVLSDSERKQL